jgi:acetylornithine deacetylase/succinyl-diaminopimelate desuccinylase-like protein
LALGQTIEGVLSGLRAHLDAKGFQDVEITFLGGGPAAKTDPDDPFIQLVANTAEEIYGVPMDLVPMIGGSGPNHAFIHHLNLPVATAGVGHPGSGAHAPNENLRLDLYTKGARHITRILKAFGA